MLGKTGIAKPERVAEMAAAIKERLSPAVESWLRFLAELLVQEVLKEHREKCCAGLKMPRGLAHEGSIPSRQGNPQRHTLRCPLLVS